MLTNDDWVEIYYALESKLRSVTVDGDRRWKAHLKEIVEKIGPGWPEYVEAIMIANNWWWDCGKREDLDIRYDDGDHDTVALLPGVPDGAAN